MSNPLDTKVLKESNTEDFMNSLTDSDWAWLPFTFLRPAKETFMTNRYILKISLYYVPLYVSVIFLSSFYNKGVRVDITTLIFSIIIFTSLFFVIYRFTFARYWNQRANRLRLKG